MGSSTGHPVDQNVFLDKQVCELFSHLGSVFCEIMWSKKHRDKNKIFEADSKTGCNETLLYRLMLWK